MKSTLAQRYHDDGMAVTPRPQLVVKLYERLLADLLHARDSVDAAETEAAHRALIHAQDIVYELSLALDIEHWEGGQPLLDLYGHLTETLVQANLRKSVVAINEAIVVVSPLLDAWRQALRITQTTQAATVSASGAVSA